MKIFTTRLLIILAVFDLTVNFAFAQEFTSNDQGPTKEILTDISFLNLSKEHVFSGKKIKAFSDKFVFQTEEKQIDSPATLILKESILAPGSLLTPPKGFQLASKVYEYQFITDEAVKLDKAFWFSIKYDSTDYLRKNIYYFDESKNEWIGIKGIISNTANKIIANVSMPQAKVAILEDIDIMTEGYASWYKYKGCNCAASPDYPKGTKLKVTNVKNGKSVIVKVNDWGPDRSVHPDRVIDLDIVAFKQIANKHAGLCLVKVEPLNQIGLTTNK
jgi:rare lipoprotein A (peptidoglycan hydrolase)